MAVRNWTLYGGRHKRYEDVENLECDDPIKGWLVGPLAKGCPWREGGVGVGFGTLLMGS